MKSEDITFKANPERGQTLVRMVQDYLRSAGWKPSGDGWWTDPHPDLADRAMNHQRLFEALGYQVRRDTGRADNQHPAVAGGRVVTAHLLVTKDYGTALRCDQNREELEVAAEQHNQQLYALPDEEEVGSSEYLRHHKDRAVITVKFLVPDSLFVRPPATTVVAFPPESAGE